VRIDCGGYLLASLLLAVIEVNFASSLEESLEGRITDVAEFLPRPSPGDHSVETTIDLLDCERKFCSHMINFGY
jgi:hypothetical protein